MPRRRSRRAPRANGGRRSQATNPSGVIPVEVDYLVPAAGTTGFQHDVTFDLLNVPARPTSLRLSVCSSSPTVWQIYALAAGAIVYESGSFTTSGNSLMRTCRAPRSSQYSVYNPSVPNILWRITGAGSGGSVRMAGVAIFSVRGVISSPVTTTPLISTQSVAERLMTMSLDIDSGNAGSL